MKLDTHSLAHTKWNCKYHIVFAPKYTPEVLEEIHMVLTQLHDAYAHIAPTNTGAPVMSNTQSVISGLTYGKGAALTEDMTCQDSNRGMLV